MIRKAKGTYDVYGELGRKISYLENFFKGLMEVYNYEYFKTPLFESSELFHRGIGDSTDIVSKETYDFLDRGNRSLTLRPEGTAGVVRSYIENKIYGRDIQPLKAWYLGSMYRYERPQANRYREFNQFGIEVLGVSSPAVDAEVIGIAVNVFTLLGLKNVSVKINSLGDKESRLIYRDKLVEYFTPHIKDFCSDCQERIISNPLRILDCKVDGDNEILKDAPTTIDSLNSESNEHFSLLMKNLNVTGIKYEVDTRIVRGLDYYNHTVFEVVADIKGFGSQNVLCGGGRYDGLVEMLDGPSTPGIGFAIGIERLLAALDAEDIKLIEADELDLFIIPTDNDLLYVSNLLQMLRMNGFKCDTDYLNRSIKSNFKQADRFNSKFVMIIGSEERESKTLTINNNNTKEEYKIHEDDLIDFLDEMLEGCDCCED